MTNYLFEAALAETEPMYDIAVITDDGTQYLKNPKCNYINNSHSVTKFFISTAVGVLVLKGMIDPDVRVLSMFDRNEIPDNIDPKWYNVTLADTLSHKTGMDTIPYSVDEDSDRPLIGNDYLKYVLSLPIERETGKYRRYSDEAYYLASRVIAKATGEPADSFLRCEVATPLAFGQWCMASCPMGHPLGGGGLFARADDIARLAFVWINYGKYNGRQMISEEYIRRAMRDDFALENREGTDIWYKTGARGQMVAFSFERRCACAWHGYSENDGNNRNDRLIQAFERTLDTL